MLEPIKGISIDVFKAAITNELPIMQTRQDLQAIIDRDGIDNVLRALHNIAHEEHDPTTPPDTSCYTQIGVRTKKLSGWAKIKNDITKRWW